MVQNYAYPYCKQATLFYKTNKYFHRNSNDAGYHKARAQSLSLSFAAPACSRNRTSMHKSTSFAQPQSKCLLLLMKG
jgi:hypothetical protein